MPAIRHWKGRTGQVWRIARGADGNGVGEKMTSPRPMSTTNGIDLSPDGKTLYVGQVRTPRDLGLSDRGHGAGSPRLVRKFTDADIDGMRTDIDGRIYVARLLKGTILILKPDGAIEREVPVDREGADQPGVRRRGRAGRCSSPSARAGSSNRSASRGPAASSACRRAA